MNFIEELIGEVFAYVKEGGCVEVSPGCYLELGSEIAAREGESSCRDDVVYYITDDGFCDSYDEDDLRKDLLSIDLSDLRHLLSQI